MSVRDVSNILREAVLQYSKKKKKKRSRSLNRHDDSNGVPISNDPSQVLQEIRHDDEVEEVFSNVSNHLDAGIIDASSSLSVQHDDEKGFDKTNNEENMESPEPSTQSVCLDREMKETEINAPVPKTSTKTISDFIRAKIMFFHKAEQADDASSFTDGKIRDWDYTFCLCGSIAKYPVSEDLMDGDGPAQTAFIQKVFMIILLKTCIILGWLKTIENVEKFKKHYQEQVDYHYLSGAAYLTIKLGIRMTKHRHDKTAILMYIMLYPLEIIAASDFLGSMVSYWLEGYPSVPRQILYTVCGALLFFIVVGAFVTYDMKDLIMLGTSFIITAIITIYQLFLSKTFLGSVDEISCALIALITSELIMGVIMFELRSVLAGLRFELCGSDWLYTSIYLV